MLCSLQDTHMQAVQSNSIGLSVWTLGRPLDGLPVAIEGLRTLQCFALQAAIEPAMEHKTSQPRPSVCGRLLPGARKCCLEPAPAVQQHGSKLRACRFAGTWRVRWIYCSGNCMLDG